MGDLYIGLMSGTSLDGVDAVLVDLLENASRYWDTDLPFSGRAQKRAVWP